MVDGWVLKRSERCRTGSNTPGVVEESIEEVVVVAQHSGIQSVRCEGTKTVSGAVTGGYGSAMVPPSGSAYLW